MEAVESKMESGPKMYLAIAQLSTKTLCQHKVRDSSLANKTARRL